MTPMKILLVNYEYPPAGGGAGRATRQLALELVRLGCRVEVLASRGKEPLECFPEPGLRIRLLSTHRKSVHETGPLAMVEFLIKSSIHLRQSARDQDVDLIMYFFSIPTGLATFLAPPATPWLVSLRGGDIPDFNPGEYRLFHALLKRANRSILRSAHAVVANSLSLAQAASRLEPGLQPLVIPNGVDAVAFSPPNREKPLPTLPLQLLLVSRLNYLKGVQYLLDALAQLPQGLFALTIIGTGFHETSLKAQCARLGLENQVRFLGSMEQQELTGHYQAADLFVLPSFGDSCSNTILEAMACGLPIVAARSGGTTELVEEGIHGFLANPQDTPSLMTTLMRFVADPTLCLTMGNRNRDWMVEKYAWSAVARQHLRLFESLLESRQKPLAHAQY
ncbi:MAG: glycosyltransferase family 4 protein [Magnetococcales bacterium]|nr:glycosyltransferase family 4 protein [Magnetococcales bacterium]